MSLKRLSRRGARAVRAGGGVFGLLLLTGAGLTAVGCGSDDGPEHEGNVDGAGTGETGGSTAGAATSGAAGGSTSGGAASGSGSSGASSSGSGASGTTGSGSNTGSTGLSGGESTGSAEPLTPYDRAKLMVGAYAVKIRYRDEVNVGIVGTDTMVTTMLATGEIVDNPSAQQVELALSLCESEMISTMVAGASSALTQKHLADLKLTASEDVLKLVDLSPVPITVTGSPGSWSWETGESYGVAGFTSTSPNDALPQRASAANVLDQDGDGNPGVSVRFSGEYEGDLYLALAYRYQFAGDLADAAEITGKAESGSREKLFGGLVENIDKVIENFGVRAEDFGIQIGGNDAAVLSAFLLTEMSRQASPETSDNTVKLVKQDRALDCSEVIARKGELF